ncbi:FeoA family protein [Desulfoglaeba alkanexedens]|jgi:Fe2+ transport system protein FeoA|uniref:Ferrous iron transport protein A n=1 Tax=Desulfoglaeba alkanexedens ALDC TaxID=980445 RepID=A0A4P8L3Y1_9BACT|nr:FeoA family protein [Desulfoglaeba alkanexedens]QCQ22599.1 ferrous iron transport protein A [Desulfoglaeba alkanexedens ALDC]
MMVNLEEADPGNVLRVVRVESSHLAHDLYRIGLEPGSKLIKFPKDEIKRRSVRVACPDGNHRVLGGGMSAKIVVERPDGSKTPLSQMKPKEQGKIIALTGGPGFRDTLKTLGFSIGDTIRLMRLLPPMEYIAVVDKHKHVHLQEGIASKIWGVSEGAERQFTSAGKRKDFEVTKLLGGARARGYLENLHIGPGTNLVLIDIEPSKPIAFGPQDHLAIETMDGLRIHLGPNEARAVFVEKV